MKQCLAVKLLKPAIKWPSTLVNSESKTFCIEDKIREKWPNNTYESCASVVCKIDC